MALGWSTSKLLLASVFWPGAPVWIKIESLSYLEGALRSDCIFPVIIRYNVPLEMTPYAASSWEPLDTAMSPLVGFCPDALLPRVCTASGWPAGYSPREAVPSTVKPFTTVANKVNINDMETNHLVFMGILPCSTYDDG